MKIKLFLISIISLLPIGTIKAAIVPCGESGNPCKLCHLFVMLDNILDFIFIDLIPPIAVLAILIGGIYFFVSSGNPQNIAKAKGILTAVAIGLLIIYGSWLLVNSFFLVIGVNEWTGLDSWFEYPCE
ncbi:MAG: hypothetical protein ABIA08_00295 [bacterium]